MRSTLAKPQLWAISVALLAQADIVPKRGITRKIKAEAWASAAATCEP